jgi:hypothetical protein
MSVYYDPDLAGEQVLHESVHLYRNLNQKMYIFALGIDPTTAVKLFDNITPNHIRKGQFLNAKAGSILDANQERHLIALETR